MRIFKSIDEKFEEIGFKKISDNSLVVAYEGKYCGGRYVHCIRILYKKDGNHEILSYDPELMDKKEIGFTSVGLTAYEAELCIKKMKQKGWLTKR